MDQVSIFVWVILGILIVLVLLRFTTRFGRIEVEAVKRTDKGRWSFDQKYNHQSPQQNTYRKPRYSNAPQYQQNSIGSSTHGQQASHPSNAQRSVGGTDHSSGDTMRCVCGNMVEDGLLVCPNCRREIRRSCPSCNRVIPVHYSRCPHCGHMFEETKPHKIDVTTRQGEGRPSVGRPLSTKVENSQGPDRKRRATKIEVRQEPVRKGPAANEGIKQQPIGGCPKCGAPIMLNTSFCRKCGWSVSHGELVRSGR